MFIDVPWLLCFLPVVSAQINISLEVDNPLKVLVSTSVVYLRWNYTIAGDEEFKEVDFYFGAGDLYIGYISTSDLIVSKKFRDRFDLERPGTLIIHNVTASDTGIYTFDVKTREATNVRSTVYLDVLGKLYLGSSEYMYVDLAKPKITLFNFHPQICILLNENSPCCFLGTN